MSSPSRFESLPAPRRFVPLVLLLIGGAWLLSGHSLETGRQWLEKSQGYGVIGFVLVGTLLMTFFVPKTFVSLAAGGLFGVFDGSWILSTTALVSAMVNYHIGRWSLAKPHHDVPGQDDEQDDPQRGQSLSQIAETAREGGVGFHVMIRLTPLPTTVISYMMGAVGARRLPYAAAAVLATPLQWLWVYCGATATSEELTIAQVAGVFCSVVAAVVLSVWIPNRILRRSHVPIENSVGV